MRLVNMHTAPLDGVKPGETADFDADNASVKQWIATRLLVSEGAMLASRAAQIAGAPSMADLAAARAELADKETVIRDLRARDAARDAEVKRMEQGFAAMAAELEAARAKVATLEADLASATAPSAPTTGASDAASTPAGESAAAPSTRQNRRG
jgi:hypothetical protein